MTKAINQAMNLSVQLAKISPDGIFFDTGDQVEDILNCNDIKQNWRIYISFCFSISPLYMYIYTYIYYVN
jgi:hypothetical protein